MECRSLITIRSVDIASTVHQSPHHVVVPAIASLVESCPAVPVLRIRKSPRVDEALRHRPMPTVGSPVEGSGTLSILGVEGSARVEEALHRVDVADLCRPVQGGPTVLILVFDASVRLDESWHRPVVAIRCQMQGGCSLLRPLVDVGSRLDDHLDSLDVALPRRVVERCFAVIILDVDVSPGFEEDLHACFVVVPRAPV